MTYSNMWPRGEWVRRHLNWTLLLYTWLTLLPASVVMGIGVATNSEGMLWIYMLLVWCAIIWGWYLMVWNLRHKGRRLWNLLYLLIPWVGGIVFLCISNRDQLAVDKAKGKAEGEERKRVAEEYWKGHEEPKIPGGY